MFEEIEAVLKQYLHAFYQKNYDKMLRILDQDELVNYRNLFVEFAEKMDVFGETEDFLKRIQIKDLKELKALSVNDFMINIFNLVTRELGEKELKRILKSLKITDIDEADFLAIVHYDVQVQIFGDWETIQSNVSMLKTSEGWKILFKSGLEMALVGFQKEIDLYYERKSRDQLDKIQHPNDLSTYKLIGYKNLDGDIVFEARFRDAGNFSEGFAYVQVMRKYGYINTKGEIAIKPQFYDARDFSEGRAAVKLGKHKGSPFWGFINKKGKLVIDAIYQETDDFSEGRSAVKKKGKWGYINKKGETIIPHQFSEANPFSDGVAYVELINKDGDIVEMVLDRKGNMVE